MVLCKEISEHAMQIIKVINKFDKGIGYQNQ